MATKTQTTHGVVTPASPALTETPVVPGSLSFDEDLAELQRAAARSTDPTLTATHIALSTTDVMDHMRARAQAGHVFGGIASESPGTLRIVFFSPPGTLSLRDPSLTVHVDLSAQRVQAIVEGSTAVHTKPQSLGRSAAPAANEQLLTGASLQAASLSAQLTEVVSVSLTGTFFHGEVAVDSVTIPRFGGAGSTSVPLLPPRVDVVLTMGASAPSTYDFSITIRGVTKKEPQGVIPGGKSTRTYSYPFATFGLPSGEGIA